MPKDAVLRAGKLVLSRRQFLLSGGAIVSTSILPSCSSIGKPSPSAASQWPEYILRRSIDEMSLHLTAVGYKERDRFSGRSLVKTEGYREPRLVFRLPPQHYAETAIPFQGSIPAVINRQQIESIRLVAAAEAQLVFAVDSNDPIPLRLDELMRWEKFRPIFPDLDNAAPKYALAIEQGDGLLTSIEMPWGIQLTPLNSQTDDAAGHRLTWRSSMPHSPSGWNELWTSTLQSSGSENLPFEVGGVRGFSNPTYSGSEANHSLHVAYRDDPAVETPDRLQVPSMTAIDRVEIGASLSRRFPYTGEGGATPKGSASIDYHHGATVTPVPACYQSGRTLPVEQFRVSARGGWLKFDGSWKPFPGCDLSGWIHSSSLGRLEEERIVRAGFLYPFGIEAELVIAVDRAFIKDEEGHYVAALVKQAYLQVPEENVTKFEHSESIFESLRITTLRTPPLDVAPNEDPSKYGTYDFFVPPVDGKPFAFEHVGTDWAGDEHTSQMPLIFVRNRSRAGNGLIWEPGSAFANTVTPSGADPNFALPTDGDGLRHVDKVWSDLPHRFAQYGLAPIATATPVNRADTSQKVEWAEWVRGQVPKFGPEGVASRPFGARARTAKVELQALSQFSGSPQTSLVTFRDTRFCHNVLLDPEPTAPDEIYYSNLPAREVDSEAPYLYCLETRPLKDAPLPLKPLNADERAALIKQMYFLSRSPAAIPDTLFLSIDNEVKFGLSASAEATGGLSVPDTHASACHRNVGVLGDATFNEARWAGYDDKVRNSLQLKGRRLDYAAFRLSRQAGNPLLYDASNDTGKVAALTDAANAFMAYPPPAASGAITTLSARPPVLSMLGDLFGAGAELLPGLPLSKLFETIVLADPSSGGGRATFLADGQEGAQPPLWSFRIVGLEWLTALLGSGPGQVSIENIIQGLSAGNQDLDDAIPIKLGVEASLAWNNKRFDPVDFGPVKFSPKPDVEFAMNAKARMDLGQGLPLDFASIKLDPSRAEFTSSAMLKKFSLKLFDAIEVIFDFVSFTMSADGNKAFETKVETVLLSGPLAFLNQLSDILGGIGSDYGIATELTPARVAISQTIRFPPTEGDPLFLGPAQVTNLSFGWALTIPLIGRGVLGISFAVSSREKPLAIFVPPWYGGKAHALLELTTQGVRLLEISMEYGAFVPINWAGGIARGEASLMAGLFYSITNDASGKRVQLQAFVKASANLTAFGFIDFGGLIFIALTSDESPDASFIRGEALVRVSVKIGFVRISREFKAEHTEKRQSRATASVSLMSTAAFAGPVARHEGAPAIALFGPDFGEERKEAFLRIVQGYV